MTKCVFSWSILVSLSAQFELDCAEFQASQGIGHVAMRILYHQQKQRRLLPFNRAAFHLSSTLELHRHHRAHGEQRIVAYRVITLRTNLQSNQSAQAGARDTSWPVESKDVPSYARTCTTAGMLVRTKAVSKPVFGPFVVVISSSGVEPARTSHVATSVAPFLQYVQSACGWVHRAKRTYQLTKTDLCDARTDKWW